MKRAVIVQGLGFGDEGKGATVDFLTRQLDADLVVRYCGGSQAGHNVVLPDGRRHSFAQFGAGTLAGAATYLGPQMIINLPAMRQEAQHLVELTGRDPFDNLAVHPRSLVSTVYHQQLNRLRELSRGANRHGSCGHGIGETRSYWLRHGQDAIYAADLFDEDCLTAKLELLRQRTLLDVQDFIARVPTAEHWRFDLLMEPAEQIAAELRQLGAPLNLSLHVPSYSTAIFEGAQGVLLDEWRGFHPHTTWSTVTMDHALALIAESGAGVVCALGITRAYTTRHGAGPLPTFDATLTQRLLDPGNPANAWQGTIRCGWLDLVLLRYATQCAGGRLDGLVVNCLDQLEGFVAKVCGRYDCSPEGSIVRLRPSTAPSLAVQEQLGSLLERASATYQEQTPSEICETLAHEIAPVAVTGKGPTWQDKVLHKLAFRPIDASAEPRSVPAT